MNNHGHLTIRDMVNQGSYYTPTKFVSVAASWLVEHGIDKSYTFLDSSCGEGAFFNLHDNFPHNRFIGSDIDSTALDIAKRQFPFATLFHHNSLTNIGRATFGLPIDAPLCVVGNPPYNDVTSQNKHIIKMKRPAVDPDVFGSDIGIMFLNSYEALRPDYVLILHPLSYLVKQANFNNAARFFCNYTLLRSLVFSSWEFGDTSRHAQFPIVMGLYKYTPSLGPSYLELRNHQYTTVEGETFALSQWCYVADYVMKYPHPIRYSPEILFYTMRDINALKRSQTFIKERCPNAVDVDPQLLPYYCYIDLFKRFADVPYWMRNFDVPFIREEFPAVADKITALSMSLHPTIFPAAESVSGEVKSEVLAYLNRCVSGLTETHRNPLIAPYRLF